MSHFIRGKRLGGERRQVNKKKFSGKKRKGNDILFNGNQMKFWRAHMGNFWETTKIVGQRPEIPWQIIGMTPNRIRLFNLQVISLFVSQLKMLVTFKILHLSRIAKFQSSKGSTRKPGRNDRCDTKCCIVLLFLRTHTYD
jgi:hypothetical protein